MSARANPSYSMRATWKGEELEPAELEELQELLEYEGELRFVSVGGSDLVFGSESLAYPHGAIHSAAKALLGHRGGGLELHGVVRVDQEAGDVAGDLAIWIFRHRGPADVEVVNPFEDRQGERALVAALRELLRTGVVHEDLKVEVTDPRDWSGRDLVSAGVVGDWTARANPADGDELDEYLSTWQRSWIGGSR